ncbi:MFS transporter [Streptomyces goshikiensis]|uniref:MFS transporter n=1 Tax=Streptomyces goshikiensis TaxID=1942 RepID=UPI0036FB479D
MIRRSPSRWLGPPGPSRRLLSATLVESIGNGCFVGTSVIYFTSSVGLPAAAVGFAMTIAGAAALAAGVPLGVVADRFGAQRVLVLALLLQGIATALLATVASVYSYALLATATAVVDRAAYAARGALMAEVFTAERVKSRARMRVMSNVGFTVGGALGGVALQVDTTAFYRTVIGLNAAAFLVSALLATGLPSVPARRSSSDRPRVMVLRDRPFLAVTAVNALICVHYGLFEVAMPLWIVEHTSAPRWLVSVLFIGNTVMVVLFQVRLSHDSEDIPGGTRALRRAGVLIFVAAAGFAAAALMPAWAAATVLVLAGAVYVVAEMLQSAGSWGLSYTLAPEDRHGEYQGAFGSGTSAGLTLAPLVATSLVIADGGWGWIVAGGLLLIATLVMTPLANTALRAKQASAGEPAHAAA